MKKINDAAGVAHLQLLIVVILTVGAIGFVGWRIMDNGNSDQAHTSTETTAAIAEPLPENIDDVLSLEKITQLAQDQKPGAVVSHVELEQEDAGLVYKVVFGDKTVLVFNARSGVLVTLPNTAQAEAHDHVLPTNFKPGVSLSQAIATAKTKFPDQKVIKVEIEVEDGAVVYSVRMTGDARVDVNAATGAVVKTESDKKDAEKSDGKKESGNQKKSGTDSSEKIDSESGNSDNGRLSPHSK